MRKIHLWFFIAIVLQIGCEDNIQSPTLELVDSIIMADPFSFDREDWPDGHYSVLEASITDDILKLQVELMGSTETDFDLVCWNYWMESNPVQADALLAYQDSDDAKKIVIERELLFDLTPMKESYLETYGAGNVIILKFRDPHHPQPGDAWLYYEF